MTRSDLSSRRSFLRAGAVLSAPLVVPVAALAGDRGAARVAQLEDERAIRDLHQAWMRGVNAGGMDGKATTLLTAGVCSTGDNLCSIGAQRAAPPDAITFDPDGMTATGRFHCAIDIETPLAQNCTLAQMAHLQGNGFVRRTATDVLYVDYIKTGKVWSVARVKFAVAGEFRHEAPPVRT
jgi:hypothetical protein